MQTLTIDNLRITAAGATPGRICYVLYPLDSLGDWIERAAKAHSVTIVAITGMDWDNDLTPWPAPGQPPGSPDFRGNADAFLSLLVGRVVPCVEQRLNISAGAERTLAGVSLSGLFALWQWMKNDTFRNIISLSGSFWYEGFAKWIKAQPAAQKTGRAYFLLGDQEAKTKVKAFQPVETDTREIVDYLHRNGVKEIFELVPGNHYQYGEQRLNRAFGWMFGQ